MSETNLRAALDNHLNIMVDSPEVSWENVPFDQRNITYLTQFLLSAENITVGMEKGGTDVLAGVYQIMVNVPKNNGKNSYLVETEKVKAHFVRGTKLVSGNTTVMIHKTWSNSAMIDEAYYRVPISIRYRAI